MNADFNNNLPIYIQISELIKSQIISGYLKPGDKLMSVREYAVFYKANPNTIQKALIELENENLIYTERTYGKFVTKDKLLIEKNKKKYAQKLAEEFLENMNKIGIDKKEALDYLK